MNQSSRTGGRHVLLATLIAMNTASPVCHAQAAATQTPPTPASAQSAGPMVAIQPLTKYVLPDQTASVMLPDGWHVTRTGIAFIRAEGPKGEIGMFGVVVPARNAPAGDGIAVSPGAPLSQAYGADTREKLQQSVLWVRAANGQGPLQVKVLSQAPFEAPAEFGTCSKMTATVGPPGGGVLAAETDFCSLPMDSAGNYRNFFKIVAISPALAATERSTMEAVLASYVLNLKAVQQQLAKRSAPAPQSGRSQAAPANAPRPGQHQSLQQQIDAEIAAGGFSPQMVAAMRAQATAQANATMAPMMHQMATFNQSIDYFDRSVLRGQIPVSITNAGTVWIDPN
jgi:hypothetical protein